MAANFVVLCIIIVFAAFAVSCFLMSTVNPPPLDVGSYSTNITAHRPVAGSPPAGGRRSGSGNYSGSGSGNHSGRWNGLEVIVMNSSGSKDSQKHSEAIELSSGPLLSLTPFYRYKLNKLSASANNTTLEEEDDIDPLFNFPPEVIKIVESPLYPPGFAPTVRTTVREIKTTTTEEIAPAKKSSMIEAVPATSTTQDNNKNFSTPTTVGSENLSPQTPEKVLRRSVNNFFNKVIDGNSSNVIMKIMDRYGQPKIEIKINTDYSFETKDSFQGSDLEITVQKNNTKYERGDLGYNTEIKILPNDTVIIDSKNNYLLNSGSVTSDMIEGEPKTANDSGNVTIPISSTDMNKNENQINKDKLKIKSMLKPSFSLKKETEKKSNASRSTIFPDLENSIKPRIDSTSKINNDNTESILHSQSKVKTDAIENMKNANLRIVDAEKEFSIFPIDENYTLTTKSLSQVHKSIVLNKQSTTTGSTSSSSAPTEITHSHELKVRFENK